MAKSKFEALSNLDHDGKRYVRGDSVELTEDQAAPLVAQGVVVPDTREPAPPPPPPPATRADDGAKGKGKK